VRSWSWLHNVAVPVVLVGVEAAWLSLWLAATAATGAGGRSHLPFVAVAVPAALAALIAGASARFPMRRWLRLLAIGVLAVAGVAFSAWALTSLLDGSLAAWVSRPWGVSGRPLHGAATLAWFVALLAWARGLWLAWEEPSARSVVFAVALDGVAFALFFLVAALDRHNRSFAALTVQASLLLLLCFPAALAALALANERELERWRLRQRSARPSIAWLLAVLVPMLAIAVVALLVGLAGGPLRPVVDDAVRGVGSALGAMIDAIARLLAGLVHVRLAAPAGQHAQGALQVPGKLGKQRGRAPLWLKVLAFSLAAVIGIVLIVLLVRLLRTLIARLRLPARVDRGGSEEEADSVFSWSHLLDQLVAALLRLFGVFRRRQPQAAHGPVAAPAVRPGAGAPPEPQEVASVRSHYRRVLRAARLAGHGRLPDETPLELEQRLSKAAEGGPPDGHDAARGALEQLTSLYDLARYGSEPVLPAGTSLGEHEISLAGRCADVLVESLVPAVDGEGEVTEGAEAG
jgi:hypothetical protein